MLNDFSLESHSTANIFINLRHPIKIPFLFIFVYTSFCSVYLPYEPYSRNMSVRSIRNLNLFFSHFLLFFLHVSIFVQSFLTFGKIVLHQKCYMSKIYILVAIHGTGSNSFNNFYRKKTTIISLNTRCFSLSVISPPKSDAIIYIKNLQEP